MKFGWFSIGKDIVDREDLDIYEKMLSIVIARFYSEDEDYELDSKILSGKMGCSEKKVEEAIQKLKSKGIIISEFQRSSKIIKRENYDYIPNLEMESIQDYQSKEMTYEDKVSVLYDIIEEKINDREAKIILNFAGGSLDLVKDKYSIVKKMQITDKIEALINELQKKDQAKTFSGEQINMVKLNRMKISSYYKK